MAKVDKVKRRIVAEELSFLNVQLVHIKSELSRLNRIQYPGLTEKERAYLSQQYDALDQVVVNIHRLWERAHRSAGHL